jgi:hypothetical protein
MDDPVQLHLNLIARLLETAGYALDVDYSAATIIVWVDNWPIHLSVKKPQPGQQAGLDDCEMRISVFAALAAADISRGFQPTVGV